MEHRLEKELRHAEKAHNKEIEDIERRYAQQCRDLDKRLQDAETALKEAKEGAYRTFASCGDVHLSERRIKTPKGKAYFKNCPVRARIEKETDTTSHPYTTKHTTPIPIIIPGVAYGGILRQRKETKSYSTTQTNKYLIIETPHFSHSYWCGLIATFTAASFAEKVNETARNWRKIKRERKKKIKEAIRNLPIVKQKVELDSARIRQEYEIAKKEADERYEIDKATRINQFRERVPTAIPPSEWK